MPSFVVLYYEPIKETREFVPGPQDNKTFLADDANQACELAGQQQKKSGLYSATPFTAITSFDVVYAPAATGSPGTWDIETMGSVALPDGGTVDSPDNVIIDGGTP